MVFPMLCSMTGAIINIILDAILIFGLAGFPALGVLGAAIATVIGQFFSMMLGFFLLFAYKHEVRVKLRHFRWNWNIAKDIYVVGFPSIIMQAISSVMLFLINGILAGYSETAVAVVGAYFRLQSFVFMPVFGLNQGAMPIMGYNYGARNQQRLMHSYYFSFKVALIITMIGTALFMIFPKQLLLLFSATPAMLEIGVPALRIIAITFIPASFGIITSTLFQATAHGMLSLWQSLIRQLIGIVPLAYLLVHHYGVDAIWWSWPIAEVLSIFFTLFFLRRVYQKDIQKL